MFCSRSGLTQERNLSKNLRQGGIIRGGEAGSESPESPLKNPLLNENPKPEVWEKEECVQEYV